MTAGGDVTVGGDVIGRDKIVNITNNYDRAPTWSEARHERNRKTLIKAVHDFWVKGVLENSLYSAALIQLGFKHKPEAIQQPWNLILLQPDQAGQVVPATTRLFRVFDDANGSLLILGAPGSGKTTALLELARDLLNRAKQDDMALVPVVFSLSTWAEARSPLAVWLVDELAKRYDVPRKVGRAWVDQDMILPLLDGLDEVKADYRDACIQAINVFRTDRESLLPMAVCSRTADYTQLRTRLRLHAAVELQALTPTQIDQQLAGLGPRGASLRLLLASDEAMRELAETPLMLSVMLIVFRDAVEFEEATAMPTAAKRDYLFESYVQKMLQPRNGLRVYTSVQADSIEADHPKSRNYSPDETRHWLTWLAQQLRQQSQSVFYLEGLQPDWLPTPTQYTFLTKGVVRFVTLMGWASVGLSIGLIVGLSGLLSWGMNLGLGDGLILSLTLGLVLGVEFGLNAGSKTIAHIEAVEILQLSWGGFRSGATAGLVGGPSVGLLIGLISGLKGGLHDGLIVGLIGGLIGGLAFGLAGGLSDGLKREQIILRTAPNEGMMRSLHYGLISGLIGWLIFGLIGGLIDGLSNGPNFGLIGGLIGGLGFGLIFGFQYGLFAYLLHITLRLLLWRNGSTPRFWAYVPFLDYCAERVLLHKVGGGYIFIHRMLLEWFAEQEIQPQ